MTAADQTTTPPANASPPVPDRRGRFARWSFVIAALVIVAAAVIGARLVHKATREGPGLSPDSRDYAQMARSLAAGTGLSHYNGDLKLVPETHFAPLFSIVL